MKEEKIIEIIENVINEREKRGIEMREEEGLQEEYWQYILELKSAKG